MREFSGRGLTFLIVVATALACSFRAATASGGEQPCGPTVASEPGWICSWAPTRRIASVAAPSTGTTRRSPG